MESSFDEKEEEVDNAHVVGFDATVGVNKIGMGVLDPNSLGTTGSILGPRQ